MNIANKRKAGSIMGRAGISERILELATELAKSKNYKHAIEVGGKIAVLADAATYDDYWGNKAAEGKRREQWKLEDIINNDKKQSL